MKKTLGYFAVAISLSLAANVYAGFTSPTLLLSTAMGAAAEGGRMAVVDGSFDFPNAVQQGYPLHLVVYQDTRFVRYPVVGGAVSGTSSTLADGLLVDAELDALQQAGTAAGGGVRILSLTPTQIRVALPQNFSAGATRAVLFTVLSDGAVISNPIDFTLP